MLRRLPDQLRIGDYLLFAESDKDLIRDIADDALARAGCGHLRVTAMLWRKALRAMHDGLHGDLRDLAEMLQKAGCDRHVVTLRSWLSTEAEPIGPRSAKDVEVVARVTGNRELSTRLNEVQLAIKDVHGAHLEASFFLARRLRQLLPSYLRDRAPSSSAADLGNMTIDLENFGTVHIVRILNMGREFMGVDASSANRLLGDDALGNDRRQMEFLL